MPRVTTWIVLRNSGASGADGAFASDHARERGRNQLGTLRGANHFIEGNRVAEIYYQATATRLGLYSDNVAVQIHAVLVALATRFAKTTFVDLRKPYATMASNCQTASWFVRHSIRNELSKACQYALAL